MLCLMANSFLLTWYSRSQVLLYLSKWMALTTCGVYCCLDDRRPILISANHEANFGTDGLRRGYRVARIGGGGGSPDFAETSPSERGTYL
jgi:hypothetical protein